MKKISFCLLIIFFVTACISDGTRNSEQNEEETATYISKGDSIVKITFDTLRNTLVKTIGEKGLAGALQFCNAAALPITASYASGGITVGRVSDKSRNVKNLLSDFDKIEWEKYTTLWANKDSLRPVVVSRNGEFHYYKPILMQSMCLNCHGTPGKEIPNDLLPVIDSLYPADKAKGYQAGDLRGMWHVVFAKK